jgi:hypothetical protein
VRRSSSCARCAASCWPSGAQKRCRAVRAVAHTHSRACTHPRMHARTHARTHAHTHKHTHTHTPARRHVHAQTCMRTHAGRHARARTRTRAHARAQIKNPSNRTDALTLICTNKADDGSYFFDEVRRVWATIPARPKWARLSTSVLCCKQACVRRRAATAGAAAISFAVKQTNTVGCAPRGMLHVAELPPCMSCLRLVGSRR